MKKNMGTIDKSIRTAVAITVCLLYLANMITGTAAIILLIFSAIFLLSSFFSFCPVYSILKINTRKKK